MSRRRCRVPFAVAFSLLSLSTFALAQAESDADFGAYCRARFPNSQYQRLSQSWGTEHACVQGGTRQGIDLAEVCELTTGSRKYRLSGARVLCDGAPADAETVHSPTPITNQNPCGSDPPTAPSPDPEEWTPPAPPLPSPSPARPPAFDAKPPGPAEPPAAKLACNALGGEWHSGTLLLVESIKAEMAAAIMGRLPMCDSLDAGREPCRRQVRVEQGIRAYFQTTMIWQCHLSYVKSPAGKDGEDLKSATEEACAIEPTLAWLARQINASGGAMDPPPHIAMGNRAKLGERCDCLLETPDFAALVRDLRSESDERLQRTAGE